MVDPRHTEPSVVEKTTEARAGSTPGVARYVLIFGLLLVVVVFVLVVLLVGRS